MINLLPPEEKEGLLLEKKKRIAMILWVLLLLFFVCLIIILFSIRVYLKDQIEIQKSLLLKSEKNLGESDSRGLQEKIDSANLVLTKLTSFYREKIYLVEFLEKISETLPQEAYLTNLLATFSDTEEEVGFEVSLSGFVPTREKLFEFKKNLEKGDIFKEIYFPPANWVKPTDINFLVTLKYR